MRNHLIFFILFCSFYTNAQPWNDLIYNADQPDLEQNPLKGFATIYGSTNTFPRSIEGRLFGLNQVMTGPNTFNWNVIDNFISAEANKGNFSYIQVNIDPAKDGNTYLPNYLFPLVDTVYYNEGNGVEGYCPDYNDPDLINAMLNFIAAFGAKYNSVDEVFLVHLGLYGMWGEWHINAVEDTKPEFEMSEANKALIANAYQSAFPNKYLLARYTENIPEPQSFGYSDGLFFGQSISDSNPFYFDNILKNYNAHQNWRQHPIGGEVDPDLQNTIWGSWPNVVGQDVVACFDSIRPTWLFAHHNVTAMVEGTPEWNNAIRAQKLMGYTFYISQSRFSAAAGKPAIEVNIENTGLAPMYANWDVQLGVFDANDQFLSLGLTDWNLGNISPNSGANYRSFISDVSLADGTYTVVLKVLNPLEVFSANAQPVRFANTTQDADSIGFITLGQTTILSGEAGTFPTPVTSLGLSPTSATLQEGTPLQLVATVLPSGATNTNITWVSSQPFTASVSASGLVVGGGSYGTAVISAYTQDGGFVGTCTVTVDPTYVTLPALIESEDYIKMSGVVTEGCCGGGYNLGYIDNNDWMEYGISVNTTADFTVKFRVASQWQGGEITLMNENGATLDIIDVPVTGEWFNYTTISSNTISLPSGFDKIRVLASEGGFNIDWIEFDQALPIELQDFSATPNRTHIDLEWSTTAEVNNKGFALERSSNSKDFRPITWVNGKGFSSELSHYSFSDRNVEKNKNYYYRLIQEDFDGSLSYSKIVQARINDSGNSGIKLFPNPTHDRLHILGDDGALELSPSKIRVLNALGAVVGPTSIAGNSIDLSALPNGVYILEFKIKEKIVVKKIVKN